MKRLTRIILRGIWRVPKYLIRIGRYARHVDRYSEEERYELLQDIAQYYTRFGGITLDVEGLENLPQEKGFVLIPNHQGMFDALAMMSVIPVPWTAVLKEELLKLSFFRKVVKIMQAKAIDRDDLRQSMRVLNEAIEEVKEGRNYVIFPEGTRNRDKNRVHEFKGGSFRIATKSGCPIVPVAFIDSYRVFDNNETVPVTVKMRILPQITQEDYKGMKTVDLAAQVQGLIQETIDKETCGKETGGNVTCGNVTCGKETGDRETCVSGEV